VSSPELRGSVAWAVVPYVPEAPFRIYRADDAPLELPSATPLFAAVQKAESEFTFLVRGKARPVFVLARIPDPRIDEYLGMRLIRLSRLSPATQARVVGNQEQLLFHVQGERIPGLKEDFAVMIAAPIRFHASAIDAENVLGRLDANEVRVVHERFAKLLSLDLVNLIHEEISRLRELQLRRETEREN
jgi:hypothetical protein